MAFDPSTYEEEIEAQIVEWDAEIEHLKARADLILVNIEGKYYSVLRELRNREHAVKKGLQEFQEARDCAKEEARRRLEKAAGDLKCAFRTVPPELV